MAFGAESFRQLGMTKGYDLANQVPNMNIDAPVADSNARYFLRGVGTQDFNALATSPIALSIDDVYLGDHSHEFSEFLRHAARGSALGATGNALPRNILIYMGRDGIEPSTSGLKVRCSTD